MVCDSLEYLKYGKIVNQTHQIYIGLSCRDVIYHPLVHIHIDLFRIPDARRPDGFLYRYISSENVVWQAVHHIFSMIIRMANCSTYVVVSHHLETRLS